MLYAFDDYLLDFARREVRCRDAAVPSEPQVFDLIVFLVRHRDRVATLDEIVEHIWDGRHVSESTIRNCINAARKTLGDDGKRQRVIRTIPRRGLRFVAEVRELDAAPGHDLPDGIKTDTSSRHVALGSGGGGEQVERIDRRPVVAVLPFVNLSGDAAQEHVGDGICEDIITILARHRTLSVIARNSVFAFKGRAGDVRQTGQALGADYVVEGSARRVHDDLRVTVHLIRTATGQLIWSDLFDRQVEDLFEVQDTITQMIVASIEPRIDSTERALVQRKKPSSLRAWDLFQLGRTHLYRATRSDNSEAQRLLRQAIDDDPEFASANAHLSYAILLSMLYFEAEPEERRLTEAHDLAQRAMELDDQDAMIRFVYGRALLARCDYGSALHELRGAVALNSALAIGHCGLGDSLAYEGRYEESFPHFQKAIELSPHDPQRWAYHAYRALAHLFARQFRLAADWARKATHIPNCHYWPYAHRVAALGHLGAEDELPSARAALLERRPGFTCSLARKRLFYIRDAEQLDLYVEGLKKAGLPEG
ncbi:MAG: winged helix-turn-helix domain-containing protein [Rhizobiaceae bacterium]|nr:winged helix-turn-helix domain-containing protein [Rhizobiaceae bacterium]MCV0407248.1 winged helix-turn-helix domain-containing protein [Rhizobiaceae bacterium]